MRFRFFNLFSGDFFFWIIDIFLIIAICLILITILMLISKVKSIFSTKLVVDLVFPILLTILIMLTQFSNGFFSLSYANFFLFNNLMVYFIYGLLFLIFFIFFLSRFYFIFENFMVLEYVIFLLFVLQASIMLLKLNNLFMIYVVIEMQNFCFYILAAMKRYSNFSTEAGLKYFLLGSFSSGLLLFGISTLYINIGTLDITELLYFSGSNSMFFIAIVFILIGLFFKLGLAPFHWWVPEIYFGAPTNITLLFSTFPKIVLLFVVTKIMYFLSFDFYTFFLFFCFSSLFFAAFNAIYQTNLKRFLAYSSIFNLGFVFSVFTLYNVEMFYSMVFFMASYLFIVCLIFCILIEVRIGRHAKEIVTLSDLSVLFKSNRWLFFIILFIIFSFAGFPPLFMFFGKFFIIVNLLNNFEYLLSFCLLCFNVLAGFYYVRLIRFLAFNSDIMNNFLVINNSFHIFFVIFF